MRNTTVYITINILINNNDFHSNARSSRALEEPRKGDFLLRCVRRLLINDINSIAVHGNAFNYAAAALHGLIDDECGAARLDFMTRYLSPGYIPDI